MSGSHREDPAVKRDFAAGERTAEETQVGGGGETTTELTQALSHWVAGTESELAKASTLAELVKVLAPRLYALGVVILQAVLEQRDAKWQDPKQRMACPKCGEATKKKKNRIGTQRKTRLGEVTHKRTLWACEAQRAPA